MFFYLVLLFTVVPAVELYLLISIGGYIGLFETIWIIILTGVVGASLARSQGRALILGIQTELNQGSLPANKMIQGLLVFAGGLLLLTPGFLTDIFGLAMVIPITRIPFALYLRYLFTKMIAKGSMQFGVGGVRPGPFGSKHGRQGAPFSTSYTVFTQESSEGYKPEIERDVTPRQVIDINPNKKNES